MTPVAADHFDDLTGEPVPGEIPEPGEADLTVRPDASRDARR
jgi:hypothetical protein